MNSRGNPQARGIDWNPVPRLPAILGAPDTLGNLSLETLDKLKKLLRHLASDNREAAIVAAIDMQGVNNTTGQSATPPEERVDFVTFVLIRMGPESEAVPTITDFVRMLLLLKISQMLRARLRLE